MEGVHWSSIRLSAANPGDAKSSSSMQAQDEHPAGSVFSPKEVAGRLSALDIESARLTVDSKVKRNNVVHLDTDPSLSPRSRPSTGGSSDFSDPSSADHAVVSVVAGGEAHAAFSTPRGEIQSDIESAVPVTNPLSQHKHVHRGFSWKVVNYCIIPLCLPAIAAYWLLSLVLAVAVTCAVVPSLYLAKQLYWACPFIPYIWSSSSVRDKFGSVGGWVMRLNFEGAHCMTVIGRLLTLAIRPHLPDFYILGFPKCGTTSMAGYLKAHPGISGLCGMPGSEIFGKESHFFGGMLGRNSTTSTLLYRSFFPTLLTRWWSEVVLGVDRWMCFDACPTYACLPHVAPRVKALTPSAKLIVMVRDPAAGVFSAETMLRNMGVPLSWTLTHPLEGDGSQDGRFQFTESDEAFWAQLESLAPNAPLPADLPERFYLKLHSYLMAGRYADRLKPWIREFGAENILLVDYERFIAQPEHTVKAALQFVGAGTSRYTFKAQSARMKGDYKGARIHPSVAAWLNKTWFADSNATLADMLAGGKAESPRWPHSN